MSDFESAILAELGRLKATDQALVEREVALRHQRSELGSRASECETALRIYRETMGITRLPPASLPLVGEISLGTIADMAHSYLERQGGAASVGELVSFLVDRGKFKPSGNRHGYYGTVFKTLSNDTRFRKVEGKGRFLLAPDAEKAKTKIAMDTSPVTVGVNDSHGATGGAADPQHLAGAALPREYGKLYE